MDSLTPLKSVSMPTEMSFQSTSLKQVTNSWALISSFLSTRFMNPNSTNQIHFPNPSPPKLMIKSIDFSKISISRIWIFAIQIQAVIPTQKKISSLKRNNSRLTNKRESSNTLYFIREKSHNLSPNMRLNQPKRRSTISRT